MIDNSLEPIVEPTDSRPRGLMVVGNLVTAIIAKLDGLYGDLIAAKDDQLAAKDELIAELRRRAERAERGLLAQGKGRAVDPRAMRALRTTDLRQNEELRLLRARVLEMEAELRGRHAPVDNRASEVSVGQAAPAATSSSEQIPPPGRAAFDGTGVLGADSAAGGHNYRIRSRVRQRRALELAAGLCGAAALTAVLVGVVIGLTAPPAHRAAKVRPALHAQVLGVAVSIPRIDRFSLVPARAGQPAHLIWHTHNATRVTLDNRPVPGQGILALRVLGPGTVYRLMAHNGPHRIMAQVRVNANLMPMAVPGLFAEIADAPIVLLNPVRLSFGPQAILTTSASQAVHVLNLGPTRLALQRLTVGGANPADFSARMTCGTAPIDVDAECVISVAFAPLAGGPRSAALLIVDNAAHPQTVLLTGRG